MTIEERTEEEKQRIKTLLFSYDISKQKTELLEDTISNIAWMKVKLDDTRETIRGTDVAIPYDNGGGQRGVRENPLFKGYESLWKSYMAGMRVIMDLLPAEEVKAIEPDRPKTVLELVRERHNA